MPDGSSPRPWGTPQRLHGRGPRPRFIPTPVGNTWRFCPHACLAAVHPHARGEHLTAMLDAREKFGSSPRPWGTHWTAKKLRAHGRFIPTPVGNTCFSRGGIGTGMVHPHARGEHAQLGCVALWILGSSPRPWGTPNSSRPLSRYCRFIPTPVGNTTLLICALVRSSVHPHARGEHWNLRNRLSATAGSSPRPWGTHLRIRRMIMEERFIPTPVGNTCDAMAGRSRHSVHPHARGEHKMLV